MYVHTGTATKFIMIGHNLSIYLLLLPVVVPWLLQPPQHLQFECSIGRSVHHFGLLLFASTADPSNILYTIILMRIANKQQQQQTYNNAKMSEKKTEEEEKRMENFFLKGWKKNHTSRVLT